MMPTENIILVIIYTLFIIALSFFFKGIKRVNPAYWYLYFHWLVGVGTILLADLSLKTDRFYIQLFFISIVCFTLGAILFMKASKIKKHYKLFWNKPVLYDRLRNRNRIILLVSFSIFIVLVYYYFVGYNLFFSILLGRTVDDFSTMRLAAYAGDRYLAPGYVNQFKNVLLPLGFTILFVMMKERNSKYFYPFVAFGIFIIMYSTLGTGQRAYFVYSFIAFIFGLYTVKNVKTKALFIGLAPVLFIFMIMSIFNQRTDGISLNHIVAELAYRAFVSNQIGGLTGFRYVYEMDIVWFSEWFQDIKGILPGVKGSDLPNRIHALLFGGSLRGTSPLTFVGSVYHNGGVVGIILVYSIKGALYMSLFNRFLKGKRTIMRSMTYGAIFFYLALFVNGTITTLLNNGFLALVGFLLIRKTKIFEGNLGSQI